LDSKNSDGYFSKFYIRRALRIFPLYFAFLAMVFLVVPLVLRPNPVAGVDAGWYLTYLQNWKANHGASDPFLGHFWSLAVEEQFYLIWPIVVLFLNARTLAVASLMVVPLALGWRVWLAASGADVEMIYRLTPCRIDALVLGALMAVCVRDEQMIVRIRRIRRRLFFTGVTSAVGIAAVAGPLWQSPLQHTLGMTVLAILFATLVFCVHTRQAGEFAFLESSLLMRIGKYSYGIYVFHMLPNRVAYQAVTNFLASTHPAVALLAKVAYMGGMFVLVYLVALLSFHVFEGPFLALKKHFTYGTVPLGQTRGGLATPPARVAAVTSAHATVDLPEIA
jgi:peptidoglycan/LPS O-acetylase OafA/YrhL